jgi:hypothetical protein
MPTDYKPKNHKPYYVPDELFTHIKSFISPPPKPTVDFPLMVGKTLDLVEDLTLIKPLINDDTYKTLIKCNILKVTYLKTEKEDDSFLVGGDYYNPSHHPDVDKIGGIVKHYKVKVNFTKMFYNVNGYQPLPDNSVINIKTIGKNKFLRVEVRFFKDKKINQNYWTVSSSCKTHLKNKSNNFPGYVLRMNFR